MKVSKYKFTEERAILTALITHDGILGRLYQQIGEERSPFRSKWSNLVARWCFDYFAKYGRAPRKTIQNLFIRYTKGQHDENLVEIIEKFLASLSQEYSSLAQEMNEKFVIDMAGTLFDKIRLERMAQAIQDAVEQDDLEGAHAQYQKYETPSFTDSSWGNPFTPEEVDTTLRHYEQGDRCLIRFGGALDKFLSPYFTRGAFISFVAPEKRGKSYWLMETVWKALRQRRRVLYYVLGDMSKTQVSLRFYLRATGRTAYSPMQIQFPTGISRNGKDPKGGFPTAEVQYEFKRTKRLDRYSIRKAVEKLQAMTATKDLRLKLKCAGASVISAGQIESDIKEFSRDGWVPDVVVIDYADLLAPEPHTLKQDFRHQVNETWKVMRRISLDYDNLIVTATQAAATSYGSWVIRKKDFSEDKRKNAHVTGMCGINQTSEEKTNGIYRLNWVFLRDGKWADTQVAWVAGNLEIAAPLIQSTL